MKKKLLSILLFIAILVCITGCSKSREESPSGKVNVKFVLVLEDQTEIPYDVQVKDGSTVREALYEAKLIDEETLSAMFVDTIDGHTADAINDGVTWLICDENGEQIMGSFDEVTVSADQTIKLVYTVVPNYDD